MSTQFPGVHSVQVYESDGELARSVSALVAPSLLLGDSVLVVATAEHRDQIRHELEHIGIDFAPYVCEGRYTALDAAEVLQSIMVGDSPDRGLFREHFGAAIAAARKRANNRNSGLTIYGECVALLWEQGRQQAALAIEQFWDELFQEGESLHLHCAYRRSVVADQGEFDSLCSAHSRVLQ